MLLAARNSYDRAGYTVTSHHLTSIGIEQSAPNEARVNAHLQAWHVRKGRATVFGLGTWAVDARKTASGWRIVEETLESPCARGYSRRGVSESDQRFAVAPDEPAQGGADQIEMKYPAPPPRRGIS